MIESFDNRRDLAILATREEALLFACSHFLETAKEAINHRGSFNVALSGGSTPKALFEALSSEEKALDWKKVALYWSDERCVPPNHSDSNYQMAMASGLKKLPIEHIFRMKGELNPEEAAKEYDELLKTQLPEGRFDLVLLGMGDDGHTASLFPKTHALHTAGGRLATANFLPNKNVWRLTLTFNCINAARNTVIYVLGEEKAKTVERVLRGPYDPDSYPIQKVGTEEHKALWVLDEKAASLL